MVIENKNGAHNKLNWIVSKRYEIFKEATLHYLKNAHHFNDQALGTVTLDDDVKIDIASLVESDED